MMLLKTFISEKRNFVEMEWKKKIEEKKNLLKNMGICQINSKKISNEYLDLKIHNFSERMKF